MFDLGRGCLLTALATLAFAQLGGCKTETEPAASNQARPSPQDVRLAVDGVEVDRLPFAEIAKRGRVPLVSLRFPDVRGWFAVEAHGGEQRQLVINQPATLHAGKLLAVYSKDGHAAFGVFAGKNPGSRVGQYLTSLRRINVLTRAPLERPKRPNALMISVAGSTPQPLSATALGGLATVSSPKTGKRQGWRLPDVITIGAAAGPVSAVTLTDVRGKAKRFAGADLRRADRLFHLKKNRRGRYRFTLWDLAVKPPRALSNLRDVRLIEVTR